MFSLADGLSDYISTSYTLPRATAKKWFWRTAIVPTPNKGKREIPPRRILNNRCGFNITAKLPAQEQPTKKHITLNITLHYSPRDLIQQHLGAESQELNTRWHLIPGSHDSDPETSDRCSAR